MSLTKSIEEINDNAEKMKGFGARFGPTHTSFSTLAYGKSFSAFIQDFNAKIDASTLSLDKKADLKEKAAALQSNVKTQFDQAIQGNARLDEARLKQSFVDLSMSLSALPPAHGPLVSEQTAALESLKNTELDREVESLAGTMKNQHNTNFSKHASYMIAKHQLGFNIDTIFVEKFGLDEEKLDNELKGIQEPHAMITSGSDSEDQRFRKKVKKLVESERRLFISEKYPGVTFEKTKNGNWWPRPPVTDNNYVNAYEGMVDLARIMLPNQVLLLSINRMSESSSHPIRTVDDVKKRILTVLEIAEKKGATMELDDETRSHLVYLRQTAGKNSKMAKMVDAVFEKEMDMLKAAKRNELFGKNAKEWADKVEERESKLVVPGTGAPGGPPTGNTMIEKFEAKKVSALAARYHLTPEEQREDAIHSLAYSELGLTGGRVADNKDVERVKGFLDELKTQIDSADSAVTLIDGQLHQLTSAHAIMPGAEALQETGHVAKLEALREKNETYLADLALRAEVYKEMLMGFNAGIAPDRAQLIAEVDQQAAKIATLQASNNEPAGLLDKIETYKNTVRPAPAAAPGGP